ncbi:murein biosynthesis integral membrane protein MurJ [Pseudoruegeria sp. SK021]|uniref:murein biosynthesis integral membrane protein MurJ n=1 Tax=Pseudoruegeria sp. SK021 TaxID=1933035 RepID=UPI000A2644C1|nr:murein biosynthesis integral membrane protein MurJ [Pseudoruegeria sp. SK021]OSP56072.1 murein biosynthesis integral membrane protein MurJ [Pseudoruegeria sp. SK021]
MKPVRMLSGMLTVGGWTMGSRLLGFVRDAMIVALLGTGPAYQAFIIAFSLPNMFRRFFAEGAFNMAFVPMFARRVETGDDPHGFAQEAFSALTSILILLLIVAQIAMPGLVYAMASGFAGDETFDIAVAFGRISFPYIVFISLAALLSGVLNATGRFAAAAAAPILLNLIFIGFMTTALWMGGDVAKALIWAVPVAGVAQFALVWWAARRAGFTLLPRMPRLTPGVRKLAIVAAPAALASGVVQLNLLIGRQVASYFDRAIDWMYTADRLYQLPLGVVGIAVGIVLMPELSRRIAATDDKGARDALSRGAEISLALTIPAAVALAVIPETLVSVLFERGRFTATDVAGTAIAVAIYGLGLPAFVLQKVQQPLFFARSDTKTPFRYAVYSMLINAALALGLAPVIGWPAAAWGTTLAAWAMVGFLWWGARSLGESAQVDARFCRRVPRQVLAAALMGAVLWLGEHVMADALTTAGIRYAALALLIVLGAVTYFTSAHLLGGLLLSDLKGSLRRKGKTGN